MHQACWTLILFIVLFLVLIDLGRTAKTAQITTARTTVKKHVTDRLLRNQTATTTVATIPLTTIAKKRLLHPSRGNQITPRGVTTPSTITGKKKLTAPLPLNQTTTTPSTTVSYLPDLRLTSWTTTETTNTESMRDVTIIDCDINNFEYTSYQNSINVSWDDCGSNYNLELSKTIYDGPEIPYIRWLNDSSFYHFINLEDCTAYNVSIESDSEIPFQATIRTLPEEVQDLTSTIQHGKITFNWSEPLSEDCKQYSVILNDEIQPQHRTNTFSTAYNQSRCTKFELALIDSENNTGGYEERMVPGVVQNLAATPQINSITVTWEAPMDDACIVGYTVALDERIANVTATEYTFRDLEACTSHTVNIAVFSDTTYGESTPVSTTTTIPATLSAVQNLFLQVLEDVLRITWDPPNLQVACVTRYGIVMWNQEPTTVNDFTTQTFYEFTPLIGCMSYNVMIKPMRGVSEGNSDTKNTIIPAKVNTPPTLASPVSINKTSATIALKLQAYNTNMCNIFKVIVNCTPEGDENILINKEQDHTDTSTRTATVDMENLLPYTNYICYAYVENPAGISNASDAIEFRTSEDFPSSPQDLNVVEDEEGLLITWKSPEEVPGVLGNYLITITPVGSMHEIPTDCEFSETPSNSETSELKYRHRNISANYMYNISVAASTGAGTGPESSKTVETDPQVPEAPPVDSWRIVNNSFGIMLMIIWSVPCKINGKLMSFQWTLVGHHLGNGTEHHRNENVEPNNSGNYLYEVSINLLEYYNYTLRLAAYVENGTGEIKGEEYVISFNTEDALPSPPQDLMVIQDEEGLLITWKEPADVIGVLGDYSVTITPIGPQHRIPEDCDVSVAPVTKFTPEMQYRHTDIFANYEYNISVAASTRAGPGPENSTTIVTAPEAPEAPGNVSRGIVNDSSGIMLVITWSVPCKINGNLRHFRWTLVGQHLGNGGERNSSGDVEPNNVGDYSYEVSINLLHYHNYTFWLAAYVENGTDKIKGEEYIDTFTTVDGLPSPPQDLIVMQDEEGLLITWKEPEDVLGVLGNYSVIITAIGPQHRIPEDCDLSVAPFRSGTSEMQYRHTDIFANYEYNISVAASTRAGFGSENSTTIVTDPEVPEAPRNVSLAHSETIDGSTGITASINWSVPCEINGVLKRFQWVLEGQHLGNGNVNERSGEVPFTESDDYRETITGLLPYHNYTFRLAAYIENGTDEIKGEEYIDTFTTVDGYPDAPTELRVENVTSASFNVLWGEPSEKHGEILSYQIMINTTGPSHMIPAGCPFPEYEKNYNYNMTSNVFLLQFTNGEPNFKYIITLVAETSAGFGKETAIEIKTESAEPEAPRDVQLMINNTLGEVYDVRVTTTWLQPCNSNGKIKYFHWILDGFSLDGETENDTRSGPVYPFGGEESFEMTIEDLEPMFIYNLSLAACVGGSDEICGEIITSDFETPDGYASPPTNITVRDVTAYSGILEWGEPGAKNGEIQMYSLKIISYGPAYYIPQGCIIAEPPSYLKNVSSTTFEFPFEGLPSYNYAANVVAMTRAGVGYEGGVNFSLNSSPSQPPREVSYSIENYKSDNYSASVTLNWILPCNTYGKLRSFFWIMVGKSEDGSTYSFNGMIIAKEESEIDYKLAINNLLPLHKYEFNIAAVVGDENRTFGEGLNKTFETPDGYPSMPSNLRTSNLTSELAFIVWDEPQNKNGRLQNYSVVITSTGPVYSLPSFCSIDYESLLHNVTVDPEMRSYAIHGRPNFHYKIQVNAATRTDYGTEATLDIITLGAAPQPIENVKANITDLKSENYSSFVEISFDKPCTLNAMFSHYSIDIFGKRTGSDDDEHIFSIDDFGNTSFPLYLQPEYSYYGHISVVTLSHNSSVAIPSFSAPAGVPPPAAAVPDVFHFTPNTASITLSDQMFDHTLGNIMYYAVIITMGMDDSVGLGGGFAFLSTLNNWPDIGYYGDSKEYQATPAFWNPFKKRATNYTYTIGNEHCSANLTSYCNGPLNPDTHYAVRVRGFTSSGYRDTAVVYFTTPAEETYLALILGLIFGIVAAIILLVFIFILWRRKRKGKEENPKEETVIEITKPPPIAKNRFVEHCLIFERDRSHLKAEYSHLDRLSAAEKPSSNVAMSDNNKRKNRYINIMPYDVTRVKLTMDSNDNYEDYINASYIKGYSRNPEYIATQGPMESTLEDFWRMIIQEDVGVIVMVAQFVEQSKQKCFKYFPEREEIISVGRDINVKCTNEVNLNEYINRTLIVEKDGEQMNIRHLQYMLWPDFGCPTDTTSMLEFREVVRKHIEMSKSKAVIHCSAGVGRTGTLIAIDILLQKIDNSDDDIDVFGTVLDLRKQRTHMVQTEKQYEYIHKCLRDYLTKPKQTSEDNLSPIYENVDIINGYANISRISGPHTSTENLIRLKEL